MEYCGVTHNRSDFAWSLWSLSQKNFTQKGQTSDRTSRSWTRRRNERTRPITTACLVGKPSMASCPKSQPHLQCSASLISGSTEDQQAESNHRRQLPPTLCKGEQRCHSCAMKPFESIQSWQDLSKARLNVMFDAAHAVREDHSSQGGLHRLHHARHCLPRGDLIPRC